MRGLSLLIGFVIVAAFGFAIYLLLETVPPAPTPEVSRPPVIAQPVTTKEKPSEVTPSPKGAAQPAPTPVVPLPAPPAVDLPVNSQPKIEPPPAPAAVVESIQPKPTPFSLPKISKGHAFAGLPLDTGRSRGLTLLVNRAYSVGYEEARRNPAWSAYRLPAEVLPQRFPRPTRFRVDTRTRAAVRHDDYTGSGYDRGHLTPNYAIATRFGSIAQEETFLMSNVIPQAADLNQGPWRALEATLADRTAPAAKEIWVVVGPVYSGSTSRLSSGSVIPTGCFMVIADETPTGPRFQAFLAPQAASRRADFRTFLVSVQAVERASGLNFHHELPDDLEVALEKNPTPYWLDLN